MGQAVETPVQIATVDDTVPTIDFVATNLAATTGPDASSKTGTTSGTFVIYGFNFTDDSTVTLSTVAGPISAAVVSVTPNEAYTELIVKLSSAEPLPTEVQLYATVTNPATVPLTSNTVQVAQVVSASTPTISMNPNPLAANATQLLIGGTNFDASGGGVNEVSLSSGTVDSVIVNSDTLLTVNVSGTLSVGVLKAKVITDGLHSSWQEVGVVVTAGTPTITPSTDPVLTTTSSLTIAGSGFDTSAIGTNTVKLYSGTTLIGTYSSPHVGSATELTVTLTPSTSPLPVGAILAVVTVDGVFDAACGVAIALPPPVITASTAQWSVGNQTLTINGTGFDPTEANNQVILSSGTCIIPPNGATSQQIIVQLTDARPPASSRPR